MEAVAGNKTGSKRAQSIATKVEIGKVYSVADAVALLKEVSTVKFVETLEIAINLGIDARKSDQTVRGATVLPNGTGKTVRVAVLAEGDAAQAAEQAGADIVGLDDLVETIQKGEINFDVLIATPASMPKIGKLGQILGPKGLMPNPKVGTVTTDTGVAVTNAKAGQVRFRADKNGIIHCPLGKLDFSAESIEQNLDALVQELKRLKPASAKGIYLKKTVISSTMGPGLQVEIAG